MRLFCSFTTQLYVTFAGKDPIPQKKCWWHSAFNISSSSSLPQSVYVVLSWYAALNKDIFDCIRVAGNVEDSV